MKDLEGSQQSRLSKQSNTVEDYDNQTLQLVNVPTGIKESWIVWFNSMYSGISTGKSQGKKWNFHCWSNSSQSLMKCTNFSALKDTK